MNTKTFFARQLRERMCCDGLCQQGRDCPVVSARREQASRAAARNLAPGVIDGPHLPRRGRIARLVVRLAHAIGAMFTRGCV